MCSSADFFSLFICTIAVIDNAAANFHAPQPPQPAFPNVNHPGRIISQQPLFGIHQDRFGHVTYVASGQAPPLAEQRPNSVSNFVLSENRSNYQANFAQQTRNEVQRNFPVQPVTDLFSSFITTAPVTIGSTVEATTTGRRLLDENTTSQPPRRQFTSAERLGFNVSGQLFDDFDHSPILATTPIQKSDVVFAVVSPPAQQRFAQQQPQIIPSGYNPSAPIYPGNQNQINPPAPYGQPPAATPPPMTQGGGYGGGTGAQPNFGMCFNRYPNTILANVAPFERTLNSSLMDCLTRCLNSLKDINTNCTGAEYVPSYMVCDLFSFPVGTPPSRYVMLYGYDFFYNNGGCKDANSAVITGVITTLSPPTTITFQPNPSPTTPVPGAICPPGTSSAFQAAPGFELLGSDGYIFVGATREDCVNACKNNQALDGTEYLCLSADYRISQQQCVLSTEAAVPTRAGILDVNSDNIYYEKTCLPGTVNCQSIDRHSQRVLENAGQSVVTATSSGDCITQCLQFAAGCLSAMYFYEDTDLNCLLNSASRVTNPEGFKDFTDKPVEYYGVDQCTNSPGAAALVAQPSGTTVRDPRVDAPRGRNFFAQSQTTREFESNNIQDSTRRVPLQQFAEHQAFIVHAQPPKKIERFEENSLKQRFDKLKTITHEPPLNESVTPTPIRFRPISRPVNTITAAVTTSRPNPAEQDDSTPLGQWLAWGSCDRKTDGRKMRRRKCSARNINQCPFQTRWCNSDIENEVNAEVLMKPFNNAFESPTSQRTVDSFTKLKLHRLDNSSKAKKERKRESILPPCIPLKGNCKIGVRLYDTGDKHYCLQPRSRLCDHLANESK